MFTDSDTINAVVRENSGLAGKILNKIQFMIAENKLRKSGTSEAKAMLQAEKLYVKAFRDAKKQESIDVKANKASSDVEYSRKTASSYNVDKVTQSTYDKYMWAIESGNITPKEYGRFFSVIGDTIHGNIELQNPDGVYVVLSYDENNNPSLIDWNGRKYREP